MNSKGQTSLEGLIVLPAAILIIGLLLWSLAVGWGLLWTQYQLNEATICLQDQDVFHCKKKFIEKLKGITSYVHITDLQAFKSSAENKMRCEVLVSFLGSHTIEMEKILSE